ncbi:MAG: hypothetical protein P8X96_19625 [Desulfobacteraceae bacterium]|jgi:hypothetical protein
MIYFKSKYLAERLHINLAKWKRWSREFLDPDPLGGYQSGFARQFSFKEAFRVFLGGHLVGILYFTIPQAGRILYDLNPWLRDNQFYIWPMPNGAPLENKRRCIYIYEPGKGRYGYAVRSIVLQDHPRSNGAHEEVYTLELIGWSNKAYASQRLTHARMIDVDALHHYFLQRVANANG